MQVDVDRYPAWPNAIEIESWAVAVGKNGMHRDWVMRSFQTGQELARATSTWCMMNGTTRRLSKITDEVRAEMEPHCTSENRSGFNKNECAATSISKLDDISAEHQSSQLTSSLVDLDMNQHVNNLKYINWVLESVPVEHMKTHKLAGIVLEYRRECHRTDLEESLTSSKANIDVQESDSNEKNASVELALESCRCQYTHLLRTQEAGQQEILRGKAAWRSRTANVTVLRNCDPHLKISEVRGVLNPRKSPCSRFVSAAIGWVAIATAFDTFFVMVFKIRSSHPCTKFVS